MGSPGPWRASPQALKGVVDYDAGDGCSRNNQSATLGGGVTAAQGVTPEEEIGGVKSSAGWQARWSAAMVERNERRKSALEKARVKGGIPLSGMLTERRASRRRILNEARAKLSVRCKELESVRRARELEPVPGCRRR